jgi:hypothetical protein
MSLAILAGNAYWIGGIGYCWIKWKITMLNPVVNSHHILVTATLVKDKFDILLGKQIIPIPHNKGQ